MEEWNARTQKSKWGVVPRAQEPLLDANKIRKLEQERDYEKAFGHKKH